MVVAGRRLHADHADAGRERRRGGGAARGEPAAADRDDEHVEVGHVLQQLERRRCPGPPSRARRRTGGRSVRPRSAARSRAMTSRSSGRSGRRAPPRRRSRASRRASPAARPPASGSSPAGPARRAAMATAWAWLPEETAKTPRSRSGVAAPLDAVRGAAELERPAALLVLGLDEHARARRPRRACARSAPACDGRRRRCAPPRRGRRRVRSRRWCLLHGRAARRRPRSASATAERMSAAPTASRACGCSPRSSHDASTPSGGSRYEHDREARRRAGREDAREEHVAERGADAHVR